jgi:hypothetical protein
MIRFIKILLLFNLIIVGWAWPCTIKKNISLYSFSGPMTTALFQLKLLSDPQLKGIFNYHQFGRIKNSQTKIFLGGVQLSKKDLTDIPKGAVIFFDTSRPLEKLLQSSDASFQLHKIETRNRLSIDLAKEVLQKVSPYLDSCELRVRELNENYDGMVKKIKSAPKKIGLFYFFLGEIKSNQLPELMVGRDLFIRDLVEYQKIKLSSTLPTYAPWSVKELRDHPGAILVGMSTKVGSQLSWEKIKFSQLGFKHETWNLYFEGAAIPGAFQLEMATYFMAKKY